MTRLNRTVWTDDKGQEMLVKKAEGSYYIPLSTISLADLKELFEVCADAIAEAEGNLSGEKK